MNKSSAFRRLAILAVSAVGLIGFAEGASASTWTANHPRRVEVNHRLHHQEQRIAHRVATGTMSLSRAVRLQRKDHAIRREERTMASLNHGHITRAEKHALNQQQNRLSRRIMK